MKRKLVKGAVVEIVRIGKGDAFYRDRERIIGSKVKLLEDPYRATWRSPYIGGPAEYLHDHPNGASLSRRTQFARIMVKAV